jgi:hypothetical protein
LKEGDTSKSLALELLIMNSNNKEKVSKIRNKLQNNHYIVSIEIITSNNLYDIFIFKPKDKFILSFEMTTYLDIDITIIKSGCENLIKNEYIGSDEFNRQFIVEELCRREN